MLRGYASLKTDIFRRDGEADIMYKKANQIESDLMKKNPKGYVSVGRKRGIKNSVGARKDSQYDISNIIDEKGTYVQLIDF
ncbi:MAG: hypothetical protein EZS28_021450 [Streblomastix strix]|uniref:Uncharacterized protein n=1 Tax=Streblomastix strix TaxID=222440 RepID=A0A5J4VKI6_9EUKA|nr:MAG: hypothetical protein EZS28_021450 [Streblomastix strix]